MTIAELQSAQRENLPIIVMVLDDQEIGMIRVKQEIKGVPLHGVKIGGVDWEARAVFRRRRRDGGHRATR
jgi:acetolactate synthase I/II/III large subunit